MRHFNTLEAHVPQHAITGDVVAVFNIGFDRWLDPDGTFLMIGLAVGGLAYQRPSGDAVRPSPHGNGEERRKTSHTTCSQFLLL